MGTIQVPGRLSGRSYSITIKGEAPSPTEQARIRQYLDEQEGAFAAQYEQTFGRPVAVDDGTAFGRGWERGVEDWRGSLGELIQTLGQRTGFEGLAEYGSGMEKAAERNLFELSLTQPEPMSFRDVRGFGSGLTYLGELTGGSALTMAGIAGGSGIAALAGAPALVGGALAAAPYYMGSIMQEQERNRGEDNVNLGAALTGGAIAAALDSASLGVLGKLGVGKAALQAMSGEVGRGLTMRLLTGAGAGALTEGTTETLQEVTQLLAAGTDPNAPEVQDRLLEALVGGGVLGGIIGGAGRGAFGKRPEAPTPPPAATPPAVTPPAVTPSAATPPAAPGPTVGFDDEGQGQLFSDLAEARAPAPATEIPPNLRRPDTAGLPLFDAVDTNKRPAAVVLDELGVSPTAPIRKRLATAVETEPRFLEALKKYAATPGLKKAHKEKLKAYLGTQATAGTGPVPTPVPAPAPAPEVTPAPAPAPEVTPALTPAPALAAAPTPAPVPEAPPVEAAPAPAPIEAAPVAEAPPVATPPAPAPIEAAPAPAPAPVAEAAPVVAPPAEAPSIKTPLVPTPTLRVPGGPTIVGANQLIPETGIRPAPGKQLASQQAAQRESIARQLSVKNQLETKMADLRTRIGTGDRMPDSLRAEAKKLGVKAAEHKKTLQRELRRLQTQHYSVMSYLNSPEGQTQAETEGATNQENIRRRAENDAARVAYRAWYDANTPADIKAYDADIRGEGLKVAPVILPETGVATAMDPKARAQALAQEAASIDALDPTTVEDKAKLLDLIRKGPRRLPGKLNENARAAFAYFSKSRDIADALDNIAADAAMPDVPGKRVSSNRETLHPYWKGTGKDAAMKAAQWVEDNLSDDTINYMDEQVAYYAEDVAEAAGDVIDRQIKNTRANEEADEKTLGPYYRAMSAIDNADVSQELGIESGVFSREKLRPMQARALGADRELLSELGLDLDGFLRMKPASIAFGLEAPLHPTVIKALRANNLRTALEALSATSSDPYISQLAKALTGFVGDTKVYTTLSADVDMRADVLHLLTDAKSGEIYPGTYVLMNEAGFRASSDVSPEYAAAIQNSVLLDEATGMDAHTILHEVLHAATARELMLNPNGPVARRLETLRQQVYDAVAKEFEDRGEELPYGLTNVREFVSEALSNQAFQGLLDRLYPTTKKVTALEQLIRTLTNFVRTRILRKPAKVYNDNKLMPARMKKGQESVFDEVDRLVRSIFNTAPEFGIYGPLYDTARRPAAAAEAFDNMGMRLRPFRPVDAVKFDNAVSQTAQMATKAELGVMPTILNLFTPNRNLIDLAAKYFPEAYRVYENLTKNNQYKQELSKEMWNTLKRAYSWLDAHPQLEQAFHSLRTRASKHEIDPRLPEKAYNSFVVRYYKYEPDGTLGKAEYEYFDSASDARDFITKINDAEKAGASTTKAKLLFTPDRETAALHRKLKADLDVLEAQAPGAKAAYTDYLNIAERLHREAGKALKQRIEAMYPGDANAYTRNTMLRGQYNKIFAERGLLAYQPLQRKGDFRISYNGVHPDTNTVEPFVHYVGSLAEAMAAREALLALPPEYKITDIEVEPRGLDAAYGKKSPVPATYVSDVVKAIKTAAVKDADAAGRAVLAAGRSQAEADAERTRVFDLLNASADANAERIVEMALNALPESSIFSAYRARTGVSGFTGDLSPLKAAFDKLENDFDAPNVSRGMFEQFMDSMTQKVGAIHQQADADLVRRYLNDRLGELRSQVGQGQMSERDYNKAVIYHETLSASLNNPTVRRMKLATGLNTGAYMFTLLGNVSSVVMNLLGAVTFVYPRLAVRYGPAEAAKMMVRSLSTIANSGRTRMEPIVGKDGNTTYEEVDAGIFGRSLRNYKFTGVDHSQGFNKGDNKTNALEYLVQEGEKRHLLVDSLIYDYLDSNKTQFNALNKMLHWGSAPLHHVERLVRESAMIANYELELRRMANEKGSDVLTEAEMKKAALTAIQEAELMTGTIPSTAAPNWAQRGIMPSIMMYKRYPLAMMHMIIRDIAHSLPTKAKLAELYGEDTAEFRNAMQERKIARLQVASVLGSVALFSGAMGMPLYGLISDIWDMFLTDDDEVGFDTLVRMGIGELGSKGILNYLFGLEFSSRIGLSDIFYRAPLRAEDQPFLWNVIEGVGGPAISIVHGWTTRSWDLYQKGEYYRALESALPATIRNGMRSARFLATGGAESLRDDIIADISPGQALAQALGFSPSAYIRQVELNSEAKRIETGIAAEKTRIMRALNMARRNGDTDAYAEALADTQRFNAKHPDKQITREALKQSRRTFARNSEKVRNGIVYSDPQSYDLQEVMRLMDEPASIWD